MHQLLGGLSHPRIRAYADLSPYDTPPEVERVGAATADAGYTAIKLRQTDIESGSADGSSSGIGSG